MSLLLNGSLEGKNPGEGDGRQEPELAFYREREMEDHGKTAGVTLGLEDQASGRYRGSEGKVTAFASFFVPSHHGIPKSPDKDYKLLPASCLGEDSW